MQAPNESKKGDDEGNENNDDDEDDDEDDHDEDEDEDEEDECDVAVDSAVASASRHTPTAQAGIHMRGAGISNGEKIGRGANRSG